MERIAALVMRRKKPFGRVEVACYALALLGVLCFIYGLKVEPHWPQVTHTTITTAKFAHGTAPVRIVLISDLHMDPEARADVKIAALIRNERPDLICFAGDAAEW